MPIVDKGKDNLMAQVQVNIIGKDRKVGAMVKALAVEVSGFQAVTGTTKEFLERNGYYLFDFPNKTRAEEFKEAVGRYLPESLATIQE